MQTLLIALLAGLGFIVAYHTYGRWLGSKIFKLSAEHVCPSEKLKDGVDYVPTSKGIVFGHHFAAIAGPGPLVGPVLAAGFFAKPTIGRPRAHQFFLDKAFGLAVGFCHEIAGAFG